MDLQLAGKRALITGSSSGLGAAIARMLAAEGVAVVIHGRDEERAHAVADEITANGGRAAVTLGAVTSAAEVEAIASAALSAFGGVDILVNSAGGLGRSDNAPWSALSDGDWHDTFDLNVVSVARFARLRTPGMIARGWGRIINISSSAGSRWGGILHQYGASKAALDHLTGNLSRSLAGKGVTVNAIVPGTILTPQAEAWLQTLKAQHAWPDDPAQIELIYTRDFLDQPIPRLGRPEEIAAAATFLASPLSDFTSGAILRIDGGMIASR